MFERSANRRRKRNHLKTLMTSMNEAIRKQDVGEFKMISDLGHEMDALGHAGEEGRCRPRKSPVSCQTSVDPDVSEWGNPSGVKAAYFHMSEVV